MKRICEWKRIEMLTRKYVREYESVGKQARETHTLIARVSEQVKERESDKERV